MREISGDGNHYIEPEPCPYCDSEEYDALYYRGGEVIGCDNCIRREWA